MVYLERNYKTDIVGEVLPVAHVTMTLTFDLLTPKSIGVFFSLSSISVLSFQVETFLSLHIIKHGQTD